MSERDHHQSINRSLAVLITPRRAKIYDVPKDHKDLSGDLGGFVLTAARSAQRRSTVCVFLWVCGGKCRRQVKLELRLEGEQGGGKRDRATSPWSSWFSPTETRITGEDSWGRYDMIT